MTSISNLSELAETAKSPGKGRWRLNYHWDALIPPQPVNPTLLECKNINRISVAKYLEAVDPKALLDLIHDWREMRKVIEDHLSCSKDARATLAGLRCEE